MRQQIRIRSLCSNESETSGFPLCGERTFENSSIQCKTIVHCIRKQCAYTYIN